MTGCYPKRALPIAHVLFPAAAVGLHPDERTVAEMLREAGYATCCIGKWHLGDQPEFLPTRQGFDEYFGIPYSNDMGPATDGSKSNPGVPLPTADEVTRRAANARNQGTDETGVKGALQPPLPLLENDQVVARVRVDEQFDLTRQYTERAVRFIRAQRDQPFFLYLPHTAVHFPLYPSKAFRGKSPNGLIGDWTEEVDWSVGQVLDTLRELKIAENTLVIFTSDNGGALPHGSSNKPLRGSKGQTLEGGLRVCTIAWWPGRIPAGTSTDSITSMMDVLPTLARLADVETAADRKIDGVDIWPVLAGTDGDKPPRENFCYFRGLKLEAVRQGAWKLHLALADGPPARRAEPKPQLFNLIEDIGETRNVAAEHPEIVKRLQQLAQSIDDDLGLDGVGPGCRELGRVQNPQPLIDRTGAVRADAVGEVKRLP
jgi:arylsulfatase A-like enzyme